MNMKQFFQASLLTLALSSAAFAVPHQQVKPVPKPQHHTAGVHAKINLNAADAKTIAKSVHGIGLKRAQAIVAYRKQHGKFKSLDDLINIKGISRRFVDSHRAHLMKEVRL